MSKIFSKLFLVVVGITFSGCATPYNYTRILERNPSMSSAQVKEKLGQPVKQTVYGFDENQVLDEIEKRNIREYAEQNKDKIIENYRKKHPEKSDTMNDSVVLEEAIVQAEQKYPEWLKESGQSSIAIYEYRPFSLPFYVVLNDDKVVYYGDFSQSEWINIYHNLGLMTDEDYRFKYSAAIEEEIADRQIRLQRARLYQEKELADQQFDYQRQKDRQEQMDRQIDHKRESPWTTTHCSRDSLGGFDCTSY